MKAEGDYFNEEIETLAPDRMLELQWGRLQERLRYLRENSPFYQKKFGQAGLDPGAVKDLDDFRRLVPFTTKDELKEERERSRDAFSRLLCVPSSEIVHLIRTGGTTGVPTIYGLTRKDLEIVGEMSARMWYQLGGRKGHTVPIGTFGSWNAFSLALQEGLRTAGITKYHFSMPAPGEEVFPLEVLPRWMDIQGIYLSPRPLRQVTLKYGPRLKELLPKLEYILMAGQHVTSAFRRGIESMWAGRLFEAYAMTDVGMPSANCTGQTQTFHFPGDAFFVEVIDPDTGEDLTGTGRVGEIVVSALVWEGTPLLRFQSGDIGFTVSETCGCGRTGMRLGIAARVDHAVSIGGRLLFSPEVEEVLYGFPEFFLKHYHLVRKKVQPQDNALIRVERPPDPNAEERLKKEIVSRIKEEIGVEAEVEYISEDDEKFVAAYKFLRVVTE